MMKLLEAWNEANGKRAVYVQTTIESYEALWPGWGQVEGEMLQFYDECRHAPWLVDGQKMVTAQDLGLAVSNLVGISDAVRNIGV